MNFLNRLVMLILALLLVAVPVVALLVTFKLLLDPNLVDTYTNYRAGLESLGSFLTSGFSFSTRTLVVVGIVSALVALVALLLLILELTPRVNRAKNSLVERDPGRETTVTSQAVTAMVDGAAREAGASSPEVSLASVKGAYRVRCRIWAPGSSNFTELATSTRENIRSMLERGSVPYRDIEVTVQGTAS